MTCAETLGQLAENMTTVLKHPVNFMSHHSAHTVTDLGDQLRCDQNTSMVDAYHLRTRYSVLSLNVTALPVKVLVGLCLPEQCTQDDLSDLAVWATGTMNHALDEFDKIVPKGLDVFGIDVVRANYTRVTTDLVQSQTRL